MYVDDCFSMSKPSILLPIFLIFVIICGVFTCVINGYIAYKICFKYMNNEYVSILYAMCVATLTLATTFAIVSILVLAMED